MAPTSTRLANETAAPWQPATPNLPQLCPAAGPPQVEEHAKLLGDGTAIVGYYQCNERLDDRELGAQGRRITERLDALHPGAAGLVLDATALQALLQREAGAGAGAPAAGEPAAPLVQLSARAAGSGQWGRVPAAAVACPSAGVGALVSGYLAEGRHQRLVDFEDHLEDISRDWLNPSLLG